MEYISKQRVCRRSHSFEDVKWPLLQWCGRREQMLNHVILSQKRWFQFNSRIVRTHFASAMTLNNCERIAETRSFIFRWRSRCLLHRIYLSSLLTQLTVKIDQIRILWDVLKKPRSHLICIRESFLHGHKLASTFSLPFLKFIAMGMY